MKYKFNLVSYGLSILTATAAFIGAGGPLQAEEKKPNIIFITGDDIGWSNIGVYNQGIMSGWTPNLGRSCDDPFLGGKIFDETTTFRGTTICPYILILDGWDEISISTTEGFKVRVAKLLEQIRAEYLQRSGACVRVILTGRPSTAVSESLFLRKQTRVLTIRPIRPEQLRKFVRDLDVALKARPAEVKDSKFDQWSLPPLNECERCSVTNLTSIRAVTCRPISRNPRPPDPLAFWRRYSA